jgi:hypothetical protein
MVHQESPMFQVSARPSFWLGLLVVPRFLATLVVSFILPWFMLVAILLAMFLIPGLVHLGFWLTLALPFAIPWFAMFWGSASNNGVSERD